MEKVDIHLAYCWYGGLYLKTFEETFEHVPLLVSTPPKKLRGFGGRGLIAATGSRAGGFGPKEKLKSKGSLNRQIDWDFPE